MLRDCVHQSIYAVVELLDVLEVTALENHWHNVVEVIAHDEFEQKFISVTEQSFCKSIRSVETICPVHWLAPRLSFDYVVRVVRGDNFLRVVVITLGTCCALRSTGLRCEIVS